MSDELTDGTPDGVPPDPVPDMQIAVPEEPSRRQIPPEVLQQVNEARTKHGLSPVSEKEVLEQMRKRQAGGRPQSRAAVPTPPPAPPAPEKLGRKILLTNGQPAGDCVLLAYAATSLHQAYGHLFQVDVETAHPEIFEGLYDTGVLTHFDHADRKVLRLPAEYETIHQSNQRAYFYLNGMLHDLSLALKLPIPPCEHTGFLTIRDEEQGWLSAPREILGEDVPYWVVNAGYKKDYTAKQWSFLEYQDVVDALPSVTFVQVGLEHKDHVHAKLEGDNVINLVGKTDLRQLIRLVWNSFGVISPCSLLMLLGFAVPPHPRFGRKSRANIAIGGGREPNHWQQGPNVHYLHTCGMLDCCDFGGCWKSRVVPIGDGDSKDNELCLYPIELQNGQTIAKCMNMIKAEDVTELVYRYLDGVMTAPEE